VRRWLSNQCATAFCRIIEWAPHQRTSVGGRFRERVFGFAQPRLQLQPIDQAIAAPSVRITDGGPRRRSKRPSAAIG
jgi:hypothetical protein